MGLASYFMTPATCFRQNLTKDLEPDLTVSSLNGLADKILTKNSNKKLRQRPVSWIVSFSRWWFQTFVLNFHPYLGKWSNLTNIFQKGWNHQQVLHMLYHARVKRDQKLCGLRVLGHFDKASEGLGMCSHNTTPGQITNWPRYEIWSQAFLWQAQSWKKWCALIWLIDTVVKQNPIQTVDHKLSYVCVDRSAIS